MSTETLNHPLSKAQIEILNLFSMKMTDDDLLNLKNVLINFLTQKLDILTNDFWDKNNFDNEKMEQLLNTHNRTTYKPK